MAKAKRVMYMPVLMFMHILDEFMYTFLLHSVDLVPSLYGKHEDVDVVWIT